MTDLRRRIVRACGLLLVLACLGAAELRADPLEFVILEGRAYNYNTGEVTRIDLGLAPNYTFQFTGPRLGVDGESTIMNFAIGFRGWDGPRSESLFITYTQTGGNSATPDSRLIPITFGPVDTLVIGALITNGRYDYAGAPFVLAFEGSINLFILGADGSVLDSLSAPFKVDRVMPAPEPATLTLLGMGLLGAGLLGKREAARRKAAGRG